MSSVHMHPRAYVCIINEMSKGKFPNLGKQSLQAKKAYRHIRKEPHTHTKKSES